MTPRAGQLGGRAAPKREGIRPAPAWRGRGGRRAPSGPPAAADVLADHGPWLLSAPTLQGLRTGRSRTRTSRRGRRVSPRRTRSARRHAAALSPRAPDLREGTGGTNQGRGGEATLITCSRNAVDYSDIYIAIIYQCASLLPAISISSYIVTIYYSQCVWLLAFVGREILLLVTLFSNF